MRKLFFLFTAVALFLCCATAVHAQVWQWVRQGIGPGGDEAYTASADTSGNVFITGGFASPSLTFGSATLTNGGSSNIFITKYDANGNALWAKSAKGSSTDEAWCVCNDRAGNAFITGVFSSHSVSFGTTTLTNAGGNNIFTAKYDPNGNVLWAKSAGGTGDDEGLWACADTSGNVYTVGYFSSSSVTFGSTTLTNASLKNNDVFIVKYDANGNVLWAQSAGDSGSDEATSVTTDKSGNAIITGKFTSSSLTFGSITITNAGNTDMFIVKYAPNGNVLWAKSMGGTGIDEGNSVSADAGGDIYITGSFTSPTLNFGFTSLINAGAYDMFIAKYDPAGNVLWARSAGGTGSEGAYCAATDISGNVFISGEYTNPMRFGTFTLLPPSVPKDPMFVAKYDASGNFDWANGLSSGGDDANGLCVTSCGQVYIGGDFMSNPFIVGPDTIARSGLENIFVAKLIDTATSAYALKATVSKPAICWGDSITLSATGATTYTWSPPAGLSTTTGTNVLGVPSASTTYTVEGRTAGCVKTYTVNVHVDPKFSSSVSQPVLLCYGNTDSAKVTINGGTAPYTYNWSNGATTPGINAAAGTYVVTVTDSSGCTSSNNITVTQPPAITASVTSADALCTTNNGSAIVTATGGTGTLTYNWSPSGGTTATATNLVPGTYTCTVTDGNGCTSQLTAQVNSTNIPPAATVCCNTTIATGDAVTINATPGYMYSWSPASGLSCTTCADPVASPAATTHYFVTITDSNGCTITNEVTITVNCEIFIPDAFSPNNDGYNDELYVRGECIKTMHFAIYDRWGNRVFETNNEQMPWDGTYKGKPMDAGTYTYYFTGTTLDNQNVRKRGNITLVR